VTAYCRPLAIKHSALLGCLDCLPQSAHLIWFYYFAMIFFRNKLGDCTARLSRLLSPIMPEEVPPS